MRGPALTAVEVWGAAEMRVSSGWCTRAEQMPSATCARRVRPQICAAAHDRAQHLHRIVRHLCSDSMSWMQAPTGIAVLIFRLLKGDCILRPCTACMCH